MGIEPMYFAWEANVLPLNYARMCPHLSVVGNQFKTDKTHHRF